MNFTARLLLPFLLLSAAACTAATDDASDDAIDPAAAASTTGREDFRRTVVFIEGQTAPGQDMFIRGGIDHGAAKSRLGLDCTAQNGLCAIPIRHRNTKNQTTAAWKIGDSLLDWYGVQSGQGRADAGSAAEGTPLDWTTNAWPASWGPTRSVAVDGFGVDPINTQNNLGAHYWMLDVDMDCARALPDADGNRWFEVKSFISNGPGWENDLRQPGAPYASGNHFALCGKVNVFARNVPTARFAEFEATKKVTCDGGRFVVAEKSNGQFEATLTNQAAIDHLVQKSEETFVDSGTYSGIPYSVVVTRKFGWMVKVEGEPGARTMTVTDFRTQNQGFSFQTSGPPGNSIDTLGPSAVRLSLRGSQMTSSKTVSYYEIGDVRFDGCTRE